MAQITNIFLILLATSPACSIRSDVGLTPVQMIENHGYVSETHHIKTEDGYILTYHRIPYRVNDKSTIKRPTFLLEHGMFSSSADYVNSGNRSLGFILADAGYDVWLGNCRGNAFSRKHTTLDPSFNPRRFFDFSWHEMGYYDLPSAIDYILGLKNDDSLYYVGHSQGTTIFFVLASMRPEYNKKIKVAHLLAPSAIMENCPNTILQSISQYAELIEQIVNLLQLYEVPLTEVARLLASNLCQIRILYFLCDFILASTMISDPKSLDSDLIAVIATNAPSNTATRQVLHFAQLIKTGKFAQYDFGPIKNMRLYGTSKPPLYNFSKITAPVALYYGQNDNVQSPADVRTIISKLPNVALDYLVPQPRFNHVDFLWSRDVVELVYNELIRITKMY